MLGSMHQRRSKQVIGDGPRLHTDAGEATEVEVAVHVLNRMLDLGRPTPCVSPERRWELGLLRPAY